MTRRNKERKKKIYRYKERNIKEDQRQKESRQI
jgi:hypothetical protein